MALKDPAAAGRILDDALRSQRRPRTRRTHQEAAAERLVEAIAALLDSGNVDPADAVAFGDARAAAEKYRQP